MINKVSKLIFSKLRVPLNLLGKMTNWLSEKTGLRGNASINTPADFADTIRYFIEGKKVCDIGSHLGHFMEDMAKYASKVIGVEFVRSRYEFCRKKGLEVYFLDATKDEMPEADVYFLCIGKAEKPLILENLRRCGKQGKLLIVRVDETEGWNMAFCWRGRKNYLKIITI